MRRFLARADKTLATQVAWGAGKADRNPTGDHIKARPQARVGRGRSLLNAERRTCFLTRALLCQLFQASQRAADHIEFVLELPDLLRPALREQAVSVCFCLLLEFARQGK